MRQTADSYRKLRCSKAGTRLPALAFAVLFAVQAGAGVGWRGLSPDPGAPMGIREPPRMLAGISMDQAIEMAERRYHARVVRASATEVNGRRVYVLRLLSEEGRVWTIRVDAETGGVI
jgi:hypothetical protein